MIKQQSQGGRSTELKAAIYENRHKASEKVIMRYEKCLVVVKCLVMPGKCLKSVNLERAGNVAEEELEVQKRKNPSTLRSYSPYSPSIGCNAKDCSHRKRRLAVDELIS
jgi:hypothetical protein